jgi:imidazolonepropionase-like amidohydrolase
MLFAFETSVPTTIVGCPIFIAKGWDKGLQMKKLVIIFCLSIGTSAQSNLSPALREFVKVDAPTVALTHIRVLDGTGTAARDDQTIVITNGKISAIGSSASTPAPKGAQVVDGTGRTAIPGLVGMHDHMFYPAGGAVYHNMQDSFPRLYLASGVTTIRTTGSIEPYSDLELKKWIDGGKMIGPKIWVTGPYLEGKDAFIPQLHQIGSPQEARDMVDFWAAQGATSFKAYNTLTREELGAAIQQAHKHDLKLTGHLCSVTFPEAIALGIDDLEHGILVDTEFTPDKKPDLCPDSAFSDQTLGSVEVSDPRVQALIKNLVSHHVAITSTLPVFEPDACGRPPLQQRVLDAMSPEANKDYLARRVRICTPKPGAPAPKGAHNLKLEEDFEREFSKAGGLLLAGEDPTGIGGTLAGFGDQREVELLVEAGFTPVEALHIAAANGADFLGESERIGTLATGKQADIVVIKGDPSKNINDVENVELVFKDGVGYDSPKLIESVQGLVGIR